MQPDKTASQVSAADMQNDHFVQDTSSGQLSFRLKKQLDSANSYWAGGNATKRNLEKQRKRNYDWWIGNHYEGVQLYEHNIPYQNNRVYVSIETSIRIAVARIAYANILPGSDKPTSQQFAADLEKSLQRIAEKRKLKKKMQTAARDLLTKYVGVIEPIFNGSLGRGGDIDFRVTDPEDVIISEKTNLFEEPDFIAVKRYATAKELAAKFPHQETMIRQRFTLQDDMLFKHDTMQRLYMEVWYDDYDEDDNKVVRCAFFLGENLDQQLGIIENPHWLPEDDPDGVRNFFETQRKPFILINYQNSGKTKIDDNAAIDQQIPLNRVLNKRGRQIAENADDASGGIVYNSKMISKEDMALLIGAPDEKIGVNGNVQNAITRVVPPILPNYVVDDKNDARQQIDEMGATTPATRGAQSRYGTLGEAVMAQQEDYTRQDGLSEAVEEGYLQCYEWACQLMKVWYTEDKMIQVRGEDGKFDYAMIRSDKIEDGTDISIVQGSSAPLNKEKNREDIKNFADKGVVDPLTLFEVTQTGEMPSPQRMVERLIKWMEDKRAYASSATDDEYDRNAQVDIELIRRNVMPDPRPEITPEYLNTFIAFITSGTFLTLDEGVQRNLQAWLEKSKNTAAQMLQLRDGMITDVAESMAVVAPPQVDPNATNPNVAPPPGTPPPEMIPALMEAGMIDQSGMPIGAPGMASGGLPSDPSQLPVQQPQQQAVPQQMPMV